MSQNLQKFLASNNVRLQLVPPYDHRTNPAEKAIDVWKCHFIAGLSSLPPDFPMHLWCRLIDHATITLNLLRPSKINPRLSAYAQLNGAFDFNSTPLAPPGCKTVVHITNDQRSTWDPKGIQAWYLGPAMQHYRCHRVYVPTTRAERIVRTVEFFPHNCAVPQASPLDNATRAADALASALQQRQPGAPFEAPGDAQMRAIQTLSNIFQRLTRTGSSDNESAPPPRVVQPTQIGTVQQPRVVATPKTTTLQKNQHATPTVTYNIPTPKNGPHIIPPDDEINDDLVMMHDPISTPRYNLRSSNKKTTQQHALAVLNQTTGSLENYPALIKGKDKATWANAYGNDLCRLAQGMPGRKHGTDVGTNTIKFIPRSAIPSNKKVTYGKKECSIRPHKQETHCVRLTVGGDKLPYTGDTATQCASLTTAKILINSTISTPGARFGCLDIKNMYYGTPMTEYEYMKILYSEIPNDVIKHYNLHHLVHKDGYVYIEIQKGMPGLKQAGKIASDRLREHLSKYGYFPCKRTPALWKHETRDITFALVVDDFGVKYVGEHNFQHLIMALKDQYEITIDEKGEKFLGLTLKWNYEHKRVNISMPGYVQKALKRFNHVAQGRKQNSPHAWNKPTYGKQQQLATDDDSKPAPASAQKHVQQVVGTFLYYALALDLTMLVALGSIATQQNHPTEMTMSEVTWFLDYCAAHPEACIEYHASDMILWTASDASYLSETNARIRAGALFFMGPKPHPPGEAPKNQPTLNGIVYALAKIIDTVMSSAMESEVGAVFLDAKEAVPIQTALEEMGHPQPPTPVQVDNTTAVGFCNEK